MQNARRSGCSAKLSATTLKPPPSAAFYEEKPAPKRAQGALAGEVTCTLALYPGGVERSLIDRFGLLSYNAATMRYERSDLTVFLCIGVRGFIEEGLPIHAPAAGKR